MLQKNWLFEITSELWLYDTFTVICTFLLVLDQRSTNTQKKNIYNFLEGELTRIQLFEQLHQGMNLIIMMLGLLNVQKLLMCGAYYDHTHWHSSKIGCQNRKLLKICDSFHLKFSFTKRRKFFDLIFKDYLVSRSYFS